jgi:hypothetical protein
MAGELTSLWLAQGAGVVDSGILPGAMFLYDTFTDVDGTIITNHIGEIGASWSLIFGAAPASPALIANNRLYATSVNQSFYQANGVPKSADYYVEALITFLPQAPNDAASVAGRISPTEATMYFGRYNNAVGAWQLFKTIAGSSTQLGSNVPGDYLGGDHLVRLTMQGSNISLSLDGAQLITANDTSITLPGSAGVRMPVAQSVTTGMQFNGIKAVAL